MPPNLPHVALLLGFMPEILTGWGPKRLDGEPEQDCRVLAPGEEKHRALRLGDCLTDDVDRLGFEE